VCALALAYHKHKDKPRAIQWGGKQKEAPPKKISFKFIGD
jgi:hypothetical protein